MNQSNCILVMAVLLSAILPTAPTARASTQGVHIVNTPHNLSVTGGGGAHDIKATDEERVCVFCHTPHHATYDGPLWSRKSNISIYVPYASPTIKANPQQPKGVSRLCLSCHDGTIALGRLSGDFDISTLGPLPPADADPRKNSNLGKDLSTTHPISMTYGLTTELYDKATLEGKGIKLAEDTFVECNTCHDPHNNQYGNFLVRDTSLQHDALCTDCHNKTGWSDVDSTHRTGGQRYLPEVSIPVAADGCISCHLPHNAQRGVHLLRQPQPLLGEETNCTGTCHKGATYTGASGPDIVTQFARPYTHPVQNYVGIHAANETLPLTSDKKHVQCVDCHNPHRAGWQGGPLGSPTPDVAPASVAPAINGALRGVRGVAITGTALPDNGSARYEYEVCFRCHAGASAADFKSGSLQRPTRLYSSYDQSLRFAPGNPSYHPVSTDTVGRTGRSLLAALQNTQMRIYCSDCHAPHGADYPYILRAQNEELFPSGAGSYPLCFSCHDQEFLLNPLAATHSGSVLLHQSHVRDHQAPCSACHDPHGAPSLRGATSTNAAHLMNFDTRYAGAAAVYDATPPNPSCTVTGTCHTSVAAQQFYPDAGLPRGIPRFTPRSVFKPAVKPARR